MPDNQPNASALLKRVRALLTFLRFDDRLETGLRVRPHAVRECLREARALEVRHTEPAINDMITDAEAESALANLLRAVEAKIAATTAPTTTTPERDLFASTDADAFYTHRALAERFGLNPEPLRKCLDRWRMNNPGASGWKENGDALAHEPKYLYKFGAIKHIIESLTTRTARPAQK
jgi:hypothetical protein